MKTIKVTFLFFVFLFIVQVTCCANFTSIKQFVLLEQDSITSHIKNMKNTELTDSIRLYHANRALFFSNKTSSQNQILNYKIYLLGKLNQYDSAIYTCKILLNSLDKKNKRKVAEHYSKMGYYYNANYQKDSAFYYYKLSNEIYSDYKDTLKIGQNLTHIAIIQSDFGDYYGSDNTAIEALKFIGNSNEVYLTTIYNCLAISSRKQKDYNEAIYWYDKAIDVSTNESNSISYLQNKANSLRDLKEYDKSITILDSLNKVGIKNNKKRAKIIDNLAYTKWLKNGHKEGDSELLYALKIRENEEDLYGLIASYGHLADFYKLEKPLMAKKYAEKMYLAAINQKSPQDQLDALKKLIELEDTPKIKKYYSSFVRINDSLNLVEKLTKNKFAKLKFDTEKNREENLNLKISNSKKELELEKEKSRNIIGAISSVTVFLGLVGFGYYRRKKHQQEKRAEVYKTETRIAKKIHDEVANNVVNIMNKLQYTKENKEVLLDDLEKVYLLTRNISHQNNTIETGKNFEDYLKIMLKSFNNNQTTIIIKDIHKIGLSKISQEKQVEIYRTLQELMVNMHKHSRATLVAISFKNNENSCFINYSDNGIGSDMKKINLKGGLKNMETRIKSINGIINFDTSLNNGFKAFISFKK